MIATWAARMIEGDVAHPLVPVVDAVLAAFADGAARPHEVARLGAFADALARSAAVTELDPELRALSHAGFLRGAMVVLATSLREAPRADVAVLLARELLDAIDVDLGVRLLHATLALPEVDGTRMTRGGIFAQANLLLGEQLRDRGDAAGALRHFEAVLAHDIDHARALRGWQQATATLERRGLLGTRPGRGLSLLDGLDELESAQAFGLARYELSRPLGRGRHAVVYQAYDRHVGRDVAIKRLLDSDGTRTASRVMQARFFDEARTLARVRSPYVVALLDVQPRHRLIALELCKGGSLRLGMRRGLVDAADLPRIAAQLRRALDAVHAAGAVHRDVKPANILLRTAFRGAPVALADFGVAQGLGPAGVGPQAGTLRYLAPELRGGASRATAASDRFGAGVVLLELLLYPTPLPDAFDRIDDDLDVTSHVPDDAPASVRDLLRSLLARDPDARRW
jgi:hypothetical protein